MASLFPRCDFTAPKSEAVVSVVVPAPNAGTMSETDEFADAMGRPWVLLLQLRTQAGQVHAGLFLKVPQRIEGADCERNARFSLELLPADAAEGEEPEAVKSFQCPRGYYFK